MFVELMKQSGKFNMFIEFGAMFRTAIAVGVYLGHNVYNREFHKPGGLGKLFTEMVQCYANEKFINEVEEMVKGLSYSTEYMNAADKYNNVKSGEINSIHLLIEKAEKACIKKAKFGRDHARLNQLQTTTETFLYGEVFSYFNTVELFIFIYIAFGLYIMLIFFIDYRDNRNVFNKYNGRSN